MTEHNLNQLHNIIRLFYPDADTKTTVHNDTVVFEIGELTLKCPITDNIPSDLYKKLCDITGKSMPWGNLTGIRPTRLAQKHGLKILGDKYFVSDKKLELLSNVIKAQEGYLPQGENLVNYYVNIPVCPSRCHYCSFAAGTIDECKGYLDDYVECLCEEIRRDGKLLKAGGHTIYSVYIGGGTPTALSAEQLEKILKAVATMLKRCHLGQNPVGQRGGDSKCDMCSRFERLAKMTPRVEFTCEAGRPDTISDQKLALLKQYGVTRICINPQSFVDKTLNAIGRSHTAEDFFGAYRLAKEYDFVINMDLIVGLADEGIEEFEYSLSKAIDLLPHNITVHTLSRKRGSLLREQEMMRQGNDNCYDEVAQMVDLAYNKLTEIGYIPYYLYRQKSQKGSLENVGYCKPNFQCINNISVMEELISVLASGAGAISKKIGAEGSPIVRYANAKDMRMYITEFEERYKAKKKLYR
ncbi:MAG: radical SAM protein [Firmicutes bacterium]|nr:radical SAM protein [Bacillota bacterium]